MKIVNNKTIIALAAFAAGFLALGISPLRADDEPVLKSHADAGLHRPGREKQVFSEAEQVFQGPPTEEGVAVGVIADPVAYVPVVVSTPDRPPMIGTIPRIPMVAPAPEVPEEEPAFVAEAEPSGPSAVEQAQVAPAGVMLSPELAGGSCSLQEGIFASERDLLIALAVGAAGLMPTLRRRKLESRI